MMHPKRILRFSSLVLLVCWSWGCAGLRLPGSPAAKPHVLLITVDTLRADHLGCYGYTHLKTPHIDSLAREGIVWKRAYTPVPITLPSHTAIMTGLYPIQTGVRNNGTCRVSKQITTLAEILRQNGYRTAAFVGAYVLDSRYGLDQGFDLYDDTLSPQEHMLSLYNERKAQEVTQSALKWIRRNKSSRFFAWVHYFDPHANYCPPGPFAEQYKDRPYDGEIAYTDYWIGDLINQLRHHGLLDNTLVVLTSDHGEGLGEHGELTHADFIYDSTLHVPLIFSYPKSLPCGIYLDEFVRTIDIMPTILSMLHLPSPACEGIDLTRLIQGKEKIPELELYCETLYPYINHNWSPLEGFRDRDWKYIQAPRSEVYSLTRDPHEKHNLFSQPGGMVQQLQQRLDRLKKHLAKRKAPEDAYLALDRESEERLRSLGYIWAGQGDTGPTEAELLPDPKDMVNIQYSIDAAAGFMSNQEYERAKDILARIIRQNQRDLFARLMLGSIHSLLKEYTLAERQFQQILSLNPEYGDVRVCLGLVYLEQGEYEKALQAFKESLRSNPDQYEILYNLGLSSSRLGLDSQALEYFQKALAVRSDQPNIHNNMGVILARQGRTEEAISSYRQAIALDPQNPKPYQNLSFLYQQQEQWNEAGNILSQALVYDPNNPDLYNGLAHLAIQRGDVAQARSFLERGLQLAPDHPGIQLQLADLYYRLGEIEKAESLYRGVLEFDPGHVQARLNLGITLGTQGRHDEAVEEYQEVLHLDPRNAEAFFNLGIALSHRHDLMGAMEAYQQAIKVNPEYLEAYLNSGILSMQQGDTEAAREAWNRVLSYDPHNTKAHYNLANMALSQRNFHEAISEYQKVLEINPDLEEAHFGLGSAYISAGRVDEAVREWEEVVRLNPERVEAWINLAVASINKGNLEEARARVSMAMQLNPALPIAHHLLTKITELEQSGL